MTDRSEVCASCEIAHSVVLHVHDGLDRVDHPEVDDRVDPDADVVLGDALLRRDGHRDDLHVDLLHAVARSGGSGQARARGQRGCTWPSRNTTPCSNCWTTFSDATGGDEPDYDQDHEDDEYRSHRDHLSPYPRASLARATRVTDI